MSFDAERIKRIDKLQKLTVFGFLRAIHGDEIIDAICYICLLFYASLPMFSTCSKLIIQCGVDDNTLKGTDECSHHAWANAFGKTWIESTSKDVIEWEIKLNKDGRFNENFLIGIISNHHQQELDICCADTTDSYGFGFLYDNEFKGYYNVDGSVVPAIDELDRKIKEGDTIHFILNMGETKLYYYINDENTNIKVLTDCVKTGEDIKYAFSVSMMPWRMRCSITFTEKRMSQSRKI